MVKTLGLKAGIEWAEVVERLFASFADEQEMCELLCPYALGCFFGNYVADNFYIRNNILFLG
jgi:hypothetical protein